MRHVRWTRAGRRLLLPTGQHVYKGFVGQRNVELEDGSFSPYAWDAIARRLRFGDLEARFVGNRVEFWRGSELQAVTRPRLERRFAGGWRAEPTRVRVEQLSDEDELRGWAFARIAIVLESERAVARHVIVAGGRSRARGDTFVRALLPGEYRVVLEHDLGAEPRAPVLSYGAAGWIAPNGWRVAWTKAEDLERTARRTARGLTIELPSVRRVAGQKRRAELFVSPDTYGPVVIAGGDDDGLSDSTAYSATGVVSGAGYVDYLFIDDSNSPAPQLCAHMRFDAVDTDGRIGSVDVGTLLTCDRTDGPGDGGNNRVVQYRCAASNSPAAGADTADVSTGRPFLRAKLASASPHTFNQGTTTQTPSVRDAIDGCRLAGYSYNGLAGDAILLLAGANNLYGITSVSWAHIGADTAHPTCDPVELTLVFTAPGGPATVTPNDLPHFRQFPARGDRGLNLPSPAATLYDNDFFGQSAASGVTGTVNVTLAAATLSAVGAAPVFGSVSQTLAAATLSATATAPVFGSVDATLAPATLSATGGAPAVTASLDATLAPATLSATGTAPVQGSVSATLAAATLSATGTAPVQSAVAITLAPATLSAAGTAPVQGTVSVTLATATLSASTSAPVQASVSATLQAATLSATGTAPVAGSVNATLAPATLSATGGSGDTVTGSLEVSLEPATLASSATAPVRGSAVLTLAPATLSAAGSAPVTAGLTQTLAAATLTAAGRVVVGASVALELAPATLTAAATAPVRATASLELAPATLDAAAQSPVVAVVEVTLAPATLEASGSQEAPAELPDGVFTMEVAPNVGVAIDAPNRAVASAALATSEAEALQPRAVAIVEPNYATAEVS